MDTESKKSRLAQMSELVVDSGDLNAIEQLNPVDATTNPSLLLKAAQDERNWQLLQEARHFALTLQPDDPASLLADAFATLVGKHISSMIPGLISTGVDARLSFDTRATLRKARQLIMLYRELGIERERVLIKIAATWQGIRAAEQLEQEGIHCNITLLFNEAQAIAAAEAGATLVSPFVGRIHDWHLRQGKVIERPEEDPGVQSVRLIYQTFKAHGWDTIVMGASFRNTGQIEALAGCDKLTISPALLAELAQDTGPLVRCLDDSDIETVDETPPLNEGQFYMAMAKDAMATELLADGIRRFIADQHTLEQHLENTES